VISDNGSHGLIVTAGQPVQLPFAVIDDCGSWNTFVGGGTGAFSR
jgi:hypothetical protein